MTPSELKTLMSECADDAIEAAKQEFNIELDNTAESISLVDDILLSFIDKYHDQVLENEAVFTICNIFGAYVGIPTGCPSPSKQTNRPSAPFERGRCRQGQHMPLCRASHPRVISNRNVRTYI